MGLLEAEPWVTCEKIALFPLYFCHGFGYYEVSVRDNTYSVLSSFGFDGNYLH